MSYAETRNEVTDTAKGSLQRDNGSDKTGSG